MVLPATARALEPGMPLLSPSLGTTACVETCRLLDALDSEEVARDGRLASLAITEMEAAHRRMALAVHSREFTAEEREELLQLAAPALTERHHTLTAAELIRLTPWFLQRVFAEGVAGGPPEEVPGADSLETIAQAEQEWDLRRADWLVETGILDRLRTNTWGDREIPATELVQQLRGDDSPVCELQGESLALAGIRAEAGAKTSGNHEKQAQEELGGHSRGVRDDVPDVGRAREVSLQAGYRSTANGTWRSLWLARVPTTPQHIDLTDPRSLPAALPWLFPFVIASGVEDAVNLPRIGTDTVEVRPNTWLIPPGARLLKDLRKTRGVSPDALEILRTGRKIARTLEIDGVVSVDTVIPGDDLSDDRTVVDLRSPFSIHSFAAWLQEREHLPLRITPATAKGTA